MRDTVAYMLYASHTYDDVCFAWAESRPLKSILTLVGQGELSACRTFSVCERVMVCWHLIHYFSTAECQNNFYQCAHFRVHMKSEGV